MDKDIQNEEQYIVNGYRFKTAEDAELARAEMKKLAYLQAKMDMSDLETVKKVYDKALEGGMFKTPDGIAFLHRLERSLIRGGMSEDEIAPIPITHVITPRRSEEITPTRARIKPAPAKTQEKGGIRFSILLNIVLIFMVIGMFVIALMSDNENILNYKRVITDKYASWEQSISEREKIVREKEHELNIAGDLSFSEE